MHTHELRSEPAGPFSWNAEVYSGSSPLTRLSISFWRKRGSFSLGEVSFTIQPKGFTVRTAILSREGTVIAQAEKPSFFRRRFLIAWDEKEVELKSQSWTGRHFLLRDGSQTIGTVTREGITGRRMRLGFDEEVPVLIQIFVVYLVTTQVAHEGGGGS